jgi:hypothetical protein
MCPAGCAPGTTRRVRGMQRATWRTTPRFGGVMVPASIGCVSHTRPHNFLPPARLAAAPSDGLPRSRTERRCVRACVRVCGTSTPNGLQIRRGKGAAAAAEVSGQGSAAPRGRAPQASTATFGRLGSVRYDVEHFCRLATTESGCPHGLLRIEDLIGGFNGRVLLDDFNEIHRLVCDRLTRERQNKTPPETIGPSRHVLCTLGASEAAGRRCAHWTGA